MGARLPGGHRMATSLSSPAAPEPVLSPALQPCGKPARSRVRPVVQATIQLSLGILAEAALSYVGLGTQPPATSWGRMLADAQTMIALAPRLAVLPGLAIVVTVLGLNLLGDGLRDLLDPRWRRLR